MQDFGQKYLNMGFSIIPLGVIKLNDKGEKVINYPISWKKYQTQLPTPEEVNNWAGKYKNIGIVTGPVSNLLILDADEYKQSFDHVLFKSLNIPPTPVQRTARGGHQYFFKYPKGLDIRNDVCIGHPTSGMDIRANGGMVIAAPTKTTYGEYSWVVSPEDCELAEVPQALMDILMKSVTTENTKPHKPLNTMVSLVEGQGRDNAITAFLGGLLVSRDPRVWDTEVYPMIEAVNNTYKPPLDKADLARIYKSITKKELDRRTKDPHSKVTTPVPVAPKVFTPSMAFSELITTEFPVARFILDPYFEANAVNMISAPPNNWKSWFMFMLAGAVASGESLWGHFKTEQAKVMIVNEEDSFRSVQDRFKLLDITDTNLPIFFHIAQGLKIDKFFVENIIKEMKEKGANVLLLDSLRSMHEAEENDSTEMQVILDHLKEIARNEITVVFTHHHRKKNPFEKEGSSESSRGSSAINAAVSGHISLDEENRENGKFMIVRHLKSKVVAKIDPVEIKITKGELTNIMSFEYQGKFKSSEKKIEQSKIAITEQLKAGGWMAVNDFIELGIASKNVIRAALNELTRTGEVKVMIRADAKKEGIELLGEGRANEKVYAWCEGAENELDSLHSELQTVDHNEVPI